MDRCGALAVGILSAAQTPGSRPGTRLQEGARMIELGALAAGSGSTGADLEQLAVEGLRDFALVALLALTVASQGVDVALFAGALCAATAASANSARPRARFSAEMVSGQRGWT